MWPEPIWTYMPIYVLYNGTENISIDVVQGLPAGQGLPADFVRVIPNAYGLPNGYGA